MLSGEEVAKLEEYLNGINRKNLRGRSLDFYDQTRARYEEHGVDMFLSAKQWEWLQNLYEGN